MACTSTNTISSKEGLGCGTAERDMAFVHSEQSLALCHVQVLGPTLHLYILPTLQLQLYLHLVVFIPPASYFCLWPETEATFGFRDIYKDILWSGENQKKHVLHPKSFMSDPVSADLDQPWPYVIEPRTSTVRSCDKNVTSSTLTFQISTWNKQKGGHHHHWPWNWRLSVVLVSARLQVHISQTGSKNGPTFKMSSKTEQATTPGFWVSKLVSTQP